MKLTKPIFIDEKAVLRLLTPQAANRLIESCFKHLADPDKVRMPPKLYLSLPKGDFRAMPVYTELGGTLAGVKWICVFPANPPKGLPSVIGTLLLNDASDGRLLAVIQANTLTAYRTGAAGAIASKYLASPKSRIFTLVGAGVQSLYQIKCHLKFFQFKEIRVWSPDVPEAEAFVRRNKAAFPRLEAYPSIEAAVRGADIVSTCTPSRRVLVRASWVKPGAHINAIGADAPGKRELETALLKKARIFVDDWEQASHSGEVNVPFSEGELKQKDVAGSLTQALNGRGRRSAAEITVFDSTGLAIQDILLGREVYRAMQKNARR